MRKRILFLLVTICAALPLAAANGTISGTVYDASGAVVPGAAVTLSNPDTQYREVVYSNDTGRFEFASADPGQLILEVMKPGFAAFRRKNVALQPDGQVRFNVALQIGSVSETIDVTAEAPAGVSPRVPTQIRIGGAVQQTRLLRKVMPVYPKSAKQLGIEGTVLLRAVIQKDGSLLSLSVVNTPPDPELAKAALDAVQQWHYEPTLLNGEPVEVITDIAVNFTLSK